jgi:hypothetical protein
MVLAGCVSGKVMNEPSHFIVIGIFMKWEVNRIMLVNAVKQFFSWPVL